MNKSYGFVEVRGLALAITTADLMVKSANVTLVDAEKTNGGGWVLIKVSGDVGAVQAAIAVGTNHAQQHSGLIASHVIARPVPELINLLNKKIKTEPQVQEFGDEQMQYPVLESVQELMLEPNKRDKPTEEAKSGQSKKSKKLDSKKYNNVEKKQ